MAKSPSFTVGPDLVSFVALGRDGALRELWPLSGQHEIWLNGIQRGWFGYERGMNAGHKVFSRQARRGSQRPDGQTAGYYVTLDKVWTFEERNLAALAAAVPGLSRQGKLLTEIEARQRAVAADEAHRSKEALRIAAENVRDMAWARRRYDEWTANCDQAAQLRSMRDRLQAAGTLSNSDVVALEEAIRLADATAAPRADQRRPHAPTPWDIPW